MGMSELDTGFGTEAAGTFNPSEDFPEEELTIEGIDFDKAVTPPDGVYLFEVVTPEVKKGQKGNYLQITSRICDGTFEGEYVYPRLFFSTNGLVKRARKALEAITNTPWDQPNFSITRSQLEALEGKQYVGVCMQETDDYGVKLEVKTFRPASSYQGESFGPTNSGSTPTAF